MPSRPKVILTHDPCSWLPAGGRAEVVLSPGLPAGGPIAVARLLVTLVDAVLVVPRPDGRGLDLPTAAVDGTLEATLDRLVAATVPFSTLTPQPLGFVRNTVPHPPQGYPWPAPVAHFAVWHLPLEPGREYPGRWLDLRHATGELGQRHWWPLVAHLPAPG